MDYIEQEQIGEAPATIESAEPREPTQHLVSEEGDHLASRPSVPQSTKSKKGTSSKKYTTALGRPPRRFININESNRSRSRDTARKTIQTSTEAAISKINQRQPLVK